MKRGMAGADADAISCSALRWYCSSRDKEHMSKLGKLGGKKVSRDKEHMARIGRIGGSQRRYRMLLATPNSPITFSQGDNAVLDLIATDNQGNPVNLTGASFSTEIQGPNNTGPVTFPNGQHSIVSATAGTFTLTLAQADTANCAIGAHKEIVTAITMGGNLASYHGFNILVVENNAPSQ